MKDIQKTLSDSMILKKKMDSRLEIHNPREKQKIKIQLELLKNSASSSANSYDASIVINDYGYSVDGVVHVIKLTIYAREYVINDNVNKKAPEIEAELHTITEKGGSLHLKYPEIASVSRDLKSTIHKEWKKYV